MHKPQGNLILNPAWLDSPPDEFPRPPIDTRAQTLPYNELSWENFERLILRIVRREGTVSECWSYGERGQKQHGIDVLAELNTSPGIFACFQCKQVNKFTATDIKKAVQAFLEGKFAGKAKKFVLCTSLQLIKTQQVTEIGKQRDILRKKGVEFETWEASEGGRLSELLKNYPALVDDFFSREWVLRFNGQDAADLLGDRLEGINLAELRSNLRAIYATLFNRADQGIRLGSAQVMPLMNRYVPPAVIEERELVLSDTRSAENIPSPKGSTNFDEGRPENQGQTARGVSIQELKIPLGSLISRHKRVVILGEPGYGKSAMLRVAALQILDGLDTPFSLPWHGRLPIWISFGGLSSAIQLQDSLSLEDYFDQWLHQHSADAIRTLFRRAVKTGEILLLIDGLDEGYNLHAAQRAVNRISTFLSIRDIPCIVTSRPRGYNELRPEGIWPIARISAFDDAQIEAFALSWFKHFEFSKPVINKSPDWVDNSAQQRTAAFLKVIRVNPKILELARTPLFCQLLIDVFRFNHRLPEQRVKVYDKIVELLLSDHPAARIHAAELPSAPDVPRAEDLKNMLIRLAIHIQSTSGAGVISIDECKRIFCEFLTDDINGPGYSLYKAQHYAKIVIEYAQGGLGLLVDRSRSELGFFHQTVQEYLAAQAIVFKNEKDQLDWLAGVWNLPRWHETVVQWFSIIGGEQGKEATQRAIDQLKKIVGGPLARLQLLCLRAELSSGELGLSPREARVTIEEAADEVETTPFAELRQELARYISLGLRSPSVANQCMERITKWVPSRSEWQRAPLIMEFSNWKISPELLNTLKVTLHDESRACRWATAEVLTKVFNSDRAIEEWLAGVAANWPDTGVRAAALYALGFGWPQHEALSRLADSACGSMDANLSLSGMAIKVAQRNLNTTDRDQMWHMLSHDAVDYTALNFLRKTLIRGWSKDEELKKRAIHVLCNRWNYHGIYTEESLLAFLTESWPRDTEVGETIASWLKSFAASFPFHIRGIWKSLFTGFRGNNEISSALWHSLREQAQRYNHIYWPDVKWVYCVIGDETAKQEVLKAYGAAKPGRDQAWITSTLMEAWPLDNDVRNLFGKEFKRFPGEVAFLSPWIDSFITDPPKRRSWLLEALRNGDRDSFADSVDRLLAEFSDKESVDAALEAQGKDIWYHHKIRIRNQMIARFPQLPEVRQWAELSFSENDGPSLEYVAKGYKNDPVFRSRLMTAARPAKEDVRAEIFKVLREQSIPSDVILNLTDEIWAEEKGEVRSAGIVARSLAVSGRDEQKKQALVAKLCEELNSVGTQYEMRRSSALAGLLQLREYSICADALGKEREGSLHWLAPYHDPDLVLTRLLFDHLDGIKEAAHAQSLEIKLPWGGLIYNGSIWVAISRSDVREELIQYIKDMKPQDRSPNSLTLMAELLPGSVELRTQLIDSMRSSARSDVSFEAERIFAEQFGGSEQPLSELVTRSNIPDEIASKPEVHRPFLYALALGWPDHPWLDLYLKGEKSVKGMSIVTAIAISGLTGNQELARQCLDRLTEFTKENQFGLQGFFSQALRSFAKMPRAEGILRNLMNDETQLYKITSAKLLSTIGRLTNKDRLELVQEFNKNLENSVNSSLSLADLVDGTVTTFPKAIFGLLMKGK